MNDVLTRTRNICLGASMGVAVFAAVYEMFSHRVYSLFLILAFLIPLVGGALPYSLLLRNRHGRKPGTLARCFYNSGLAALTAGSMFRGILEIYGTTSRLSLCYRVAGFGFLLLGLAAYAAAAIRASGGSQMRRSLTR